MMEGRLFIDGGDAYLQYGAYVVNGGWNELVAYPPLKPVESNDWQEEDGIEADLSAPVLDTREVREILGEGVPLSSPEVRMFLKEYIQENLVDIFGGRL